MNFILVVSDTFRRDHLSAYGAQPAQWASGGGWKVETPSLDGFAARAALFEQCVIGSFPTVPNRREIFTGRSVFTYAHWSPLPPSETVLSQVLSNHGYTTMLIADTPHILQRGFHFDRGFSGFNWIRGQENDRLATDPRDVRLPAAPHKLREPERTLKQHLRNTAHWKHEADRFCPTTFRTGCEWLERNRRNGPFYLHLDTFDPHEPWDAPQWYADRFDPGYEGDSVTYPVYGFWREFLSPSELRHAHALYCAELAMVDRWFGLILNAMDRLELWDDTALIFTSDHGFYFGEHGIIGKTIIEPGGFARPFPIHSEVSRVPLIAHIPGLTRPGQRVKGFVQPGDLMPTILQLAGVSQPEMVQGRSFLPLVTEEAAAIRDFAVSSFSIDAPIAGRPSTITDGRWTLLLGAPESAGLPVSASGGYAGGMVVPATEAVDSILRTERPHADALTPQLYDESADPGHFRNVVKQRPDVARELKGLYISYLESTGTPEEFIAPRRTMSFD